MTLSIGTVKDAEDIVKLLESAVKESPYSGLPIDRGYLYSFTVEYLKGSIADKVVILLKDIDKPVGLLVGIIDHGHPMMYSCKVANELLWWVHPDYRGTPDSFALIEAYEQWAKELKCTHIHLAHFENKFSKKLSKHYTDMGYSKVEVSYLKELS